MSDILKKSKLKGKAGVYSYSCMICLKKDSLTAPEFLMRNFKLNINLYI